MELKVLLVATIEFFLGEAKLIELSYTYNEDAPTSPKLTPFSHQTLKKGLNEQGIWTELNNFCSSEHSGTHVDAPVHFAEHGWAVDDIPIQRLWRIPAVVIDVSKQVKLSSIQNYEIKVKDLEQWEKANGVIPDGSLVLLRTGWGAKVGNLAEYSGIDRHKQNNFPGLGIGGCQMLAKHGLSNGHQTGVIGVGVDTISVDVGRSVRYPAHVTLYAENIYGIENMANLDKLPVKGANVTIFPMRIGGGSGAPARIIAEVYDPNEITSAGWNLQASRMIIITVLLAIFARDIFRLV